MLLSAIKHRRQKQSDCLVICAAIVLEYLGVSWSEEYLARVLGMSEDGTPFFHIERLQKLGVAVNADRDGDLAIFEHALEMGLPVIAGVMTLGWQHWHGETVPHAVVVVGIDQENALIYIDDPAAVNAPIEMSLDEFMIGWEEKERQFAVIGLSEE